MILDELPIMLMPEAVITSYSVSINVNLFLSVQTSVSHNTYSIISYIFYFLFTSTCYINIIHNFQKKLSGQCIQELHDNTDVKGGGVSHVHMWTWWSVVLTEKVKLSEMGFSCPCPSCPGGAGGVVTVGAV